jgi:hypothetical protein
MVERVDGLSPGVLGFRLSQRLTRDEYQDELMRPIYAALERGEQLNLYFEFADDFSGLDAGDRSAWGRVALATDKDWIRHGVSAFGWLGPGELRVFTPEEQSAARSWVAGSSAA